MPENIWKGAKVERATTSYSAWAKAISKAEGALYIDLNDLVATRYEQLGPDKVRTMVFLQDHTHTSAAGAKITAGIVADALRNQKNIKLRKYLQ